ncbi:hypothetical protein, partial [Nocardioides sp.]|uniref:hypothetical protein n=1 Tax=Nocardioides sp. TaxID=35761 RepID=UPI002B26DEC8
MVTETYTVVACPYSWKPVGTDEGDPTFHVSLFVAPRLIPDGEQGRLDEFELFVRWGRLLPDLHLELADQQGLLEARPVTRRFESTWWEQLFPSDTPVVGNGVPTAWAETPFDWRSFDARAIADLATHHQVIAAASSLVDLPAASESPLFEALKKDLAPGYVDG